MKTSIISVFFILFSGYLCASGEQSLVEQGNTAYTDGLYTDAATAYRKVVESGYESPELFYNLGNTYFKLDDFPRAILWYERALRLDPSNEDIHHNLQVANSKIPDKIDAIPELFYQKWFRGIVRLFPVNQWAILTIASFLLSLISISFYLMSRNMFLRKTGFWAAGLFLVLTIFTVACSVSEYHQLKNTREAIVFDPTITVKSSPDDKSVDLFVLHEGTKVQILDRIGVWYEIRIANGSVGWLPESSLEKI